VSMLLGTVVMLTGCAVRSRALSSSTASASSAMTYRLPSHPVARRVLETWFGPCYAADFSDSAMDACDPLHWGIRRSPAGVAPVSPDEQAATDAALRREFGDTLEAARRGELDADAWIDESSPARGALAHIILCDQIARNVYRKRPEAFSLDVAHDALRLIDSSEDTAYREELHPFERIFCLLPLEHSESVAHHDRCEAAFDALVADCEAGAYSGAVLDRVRQSRQFAVDHAAVVRRFGRYVRAIESCVMHV